VRLELRHLRTVCAIAQSGSLTRAAATMGVSQPALTAQLRRIESLLGHRVFDRSRRGVLPTSYGRFVIRRARAALKNVDELAMSTEPGVARFGGTPEPTLTALLGGMYALLPSVRITVRTEHSARLLLDMLVARHLDAALLIDYPGYELPRRSSIDRRVIAREPLSVALPSGHRLARRAEVALADLAAERWALPSPDGTGWPECFVAACREHGFEPGVRYVMTEPSMLRGIIAEGRAVAPCRATFAADAGIAVRAIEGAPLWVRRLLAWRRDGAFAHVADELTRLAGRAHAETVAERPQHAVRAAQGPVTADSDGPEEPEWPSYTPA